MSLLRDANYLKIEKKQGKKQEKIEMWQKESEKKNSPVVILWLGAVYKNIQLIMKVTISVR